MKVVSGSLLLTFMTSWLCAFPCMAADWSLTDNPQLAAFFEEEVQRIERRNSLTQYRTLEEWNAAKPRLRQQLFEMLGLDPLPERTDLEAEVSGVAEHEEFRMERISFQSMPGLYVSGNLYIPKKMDGPLPAVLYVCGHGNVKKDGISYGSKASYQRHGGWFARNGYVCLVIDTLQLGEIEGIHHGTYRYNRWWWNARGYTPAGVEAWNCMRALDYLQSRSEVDGSRLGVTGRSGGGAYSWWIAALDDRIQCAVPVAGITSMRNHVADGCVEGHCDCMYMVNTYGWDYAVVAALVAPRPLLISNTDKDTIFPLEGVVDIHRQVRHIYRLYGMPEHLGLQITEGPHKDTQELHVHAFRWMNRFLRKDESMISKLVEDFFVPEQLRVFTAIPKDERNTTIDEVFVPFRSQPSASEDAGILADLPRWEQSLLEILRDKCFAAWPENRSDWQATAVSLRETLKSGPFWTSAFPEHVVSRLHFESQPSVPLFVDVIHAKNVPPAKVARIHLLAVDDLTWSAYERILAGQNDADSSTSTDDVSSVFRLIQGHLKESGSAVAVFSSRGIGAQKWKGDEKKQIQIQRRFQLLGMTADGMRVWDLRRALQILRSEAGDEVNLSLQALGRQGLLAICVGIYERLPGGLFVDAASLPTDDTGPVILNQQRLIHVQELAALALRKNAITVRGDSPLTDLSRRLTEAPQWTGGHLTLEP